MGLGEYLTNCDALWKELRSRLNDADIAELDAEIAAIGEDGWSQWRKEHLESITKFTTSTPTQREKIKDANLYKKLVFASLQRCTGGVHLLLALKENGIEEPFHLSYRDMLVTASAAYTDIISKPFPWVPSDLYHWESLSPLEYAEIEFRRAVKKMECSTKR